MPRGCKGYDRKGWNVPCDPIRVSFVIGECNNMGFLRWLFGIKDDPQEEINGIYAKAYHERRSLTRGEKARIKRLETDDIDDTNDKGRGLSLRW